MVRKRLLILASLSLLSLACSREGGKDGDSSKLSIRIPKSSGFNKAGMVGGFTIPPSRKQCYGVSVTGSGIDSKRGNSCTPYTGIISGFAPEGGTLTVEVPRGSARKIELFLYLLSGPSGTCPVFRDSLDHAQRTHMYVMGVATVDIFEPEVDVKIYSNYPGDTNNLAASFPVSCDGSGIVAGDNKIRGGRISTSAQTAWNVGNTVGVRGHVNFVK